MNAPRRAFTLVELLVVIAIIGVMVAMTIPAIQASRETGRRNLCRQHMAQLLLALQGYENAFEVYPPGVVNPDGPIRSEPSGLHQGWLLHLLPYLDEQVAYNQFDFSKSVYVEPNTKIRDYWPNVVICPTEPNDIPGASNYAGCHHDVETPIAADNNGVLFLNSRIRREDVSDGLSHTFFLGEKRADPGDLGWTSGTRATLRNTGLVPNDPATDPGSAIKPAPNAAAETKAGQPAPADPTASPTYVGGFASPHSGGLHMGFGDASVQFVSESIDPKLWRQLANRADGSLVQLRSEE